MAYAAPPRNIAERHLQCRACQKRLKDPKLLPCLHQRCTNCLKMIVAEGDSTVECPSCHEHHDLPADGVEGLKTDFLLQSYIQLIELQHSVREEPRRICIHCGSNLKASAYCFECADFLCESCHVIHKTSKRVQHHRPHILPLDDVEGLTDLTPRKFSSLSRAPGCRSHSGEVSQLCCGTCGNIPICVKCTYGAHRGHELRDAESLAKAERAKLRKGIIELRKYRDAIYKGQKSVQCGRDIKVVMKRRSTAREEEWERNIKRMKIHGERRRYGSRGLRRDKLMVANRQEVQEATVVTEMLDRSEIFMKKFERINNIASGYLAAEHVWTDAFCSPVVNEAIHSLIGETKREFPELNIPLEEMDTSFHPAVTSRRITITERKEWEIHISESSPRGTADVTGDGRNDGSLRRTREEIRTGKQYNTMVPSSSDTVRRNKPASPLARKWNNISDKMEYSIRIDQDRVSDITGSMDSKIMVTGRVNKFGTYITVINMKGDWQCSYDCHKTHAGSERFCCTLSRTQIANVCTPNEVGIYDMGRNNYRCIHIRNIIVAPASIRTDSIATDRDGKRIFAGCASSRCVYVVNEQLDHVSVLMLPKQVETVGALAFHRGSLLVSDYKRVHALSIVGTMQSLKSRCEAAYEFERPRVPGDEWSPKSVCTDRNGFVYILWREGEEPERQGECIIAQYDRDGGKILTIRSLGDGTDATCITVVKTEHAEKILILSDKKREILVYGITKDDRFHHRAVVDSTMFESPKSRSPSPSSRSSNPRFSSRSQSRKFSSSKKILACM